ncbi:MAG: phosphoribosyltransferase [Deltaproteobacteria bacterium]|nr:phosphoribosyltransferase [Deltaproteobacteria bacterium]
MTTSSIEQLLMTSGALLRDGHFLYASGRHGNAYFNKDALYTDPVLMKQLGEAMALPFIGTAIEAVAGPTVGGVILAQWVAYHLQEKTGRRIVACFAEERPTIGGAHVPCGSASGYSLVHPLRGCPDSVVATAAGTKERFFGRGYDRLIASRRVLVVEDVLTTGGSVRQVVDAVRRVGGIPVGVSALCNRGGVTIESLAVPTLHALLSLILESWPAQDCPLCRRGIPINTSLGKGGKSA